MFFFIKGEVNHAINLNKLMVKMEKGGREKGERRKVC